MALPIHRTIVSIFSIPQDAQRAVMDLQAAGFTREQIGVLSRNQDGQVVGHKTADNSQAMRAGTGAAAGAGVGALWGLGILAGVLPGIGPAIAGGTLGMLLSNAAAGAAAVGIAGALTGLGVPAEEADFYEGEFKSGRTLVTVKSGVKSAPVQQIIELNGGHCRHPQTAADSSHK